MSLYQLNEAQAVATLRAQLALRDVHRHDVTRMLEAIGQHPAAMIANAVDECRGEPCPYCCAQPWEGCRPDCSSHFDATCRLCGRHIVNEGGRWVDPEATGDDIEWADVCEGSETFTAEHEPDS